MKVSKNSVFIGVFSLTLSNIALQLLGFFYRICIGRIIGAEGMGIYQLILPFYSVVISITMSGLTIAVSRIAAEYNAFNNDTGARKAVKLSQIMFVALFVCVAIPTIQYSEWISTNLLGNDKTRAALCFLLPCLFLTGFENIFKNFYFGKKKLTPPIISELTEQIVRIAAVVILLLTFRTGDSGVNAVLIVAGMTISEIISVFLLSAMYSKHQRLPTYIKPEPTLKLLSKIGSIALPISAAGALTNILCSANSVLIPRRLVSSGMEMSAALGEFGVLFGMIMPLLFLPIAFIAPLTVIIIPKLSEGIAMKNPDDVKRKAGKAVHVTGLMTFPAMAALIPLGDVACRLIYNQSGAGRYMLPLCIATVFSYYQITTNAVLNGIGLQKRAAIHVIIGSVIQLAFTWSVGYPQIGMRGFIIGCVVSDMLMAVLNMSYMIKKLEMKIRWFNWFGIPIICSTLAGLIINLSFKLLIFDGVGEWQALLISVLMGGLCYMVTLNLMGTSISGYMTKITR